MLGLKRKLKLEAVKVEELKPKPLDITATYEEMGWPDEKVPTFLVNDGKIVDVYYVDFSWEHDRYGNHILSPKPGTTLAIKESGDRLIFESSLGCYELARYFYPGDTVTLGPGRSPFWGPCQRKAGF